MAGDTANVRVWTHADVYVAPVGTTAPTDIETELAEEWKALGLLHEDGLTFGRENESTDLFEFSGGLVKTIRSKHKRTFTVTPLENSHLVWSLANPGSTAATVQGDPGAKAVTTRTVKTPISGDMRAFVIELREGDLAIARRVVPRGELVEIAEETILSTDYPVGEWTINIYPTADGVLFLEITDDAAAVVSA